ncbi:hypothetical protein Ddye_008676 [Dipteronia dyeriana]|uniref:MULE transposase domain-containing protein n=1 Tax=Dipteronia dyeriana TaxID=168575 RepID=A0AAD9XA08_9ROSI|nr:hypothetical protein Ddye_008676 [Dipteronia dyeriana]
MFKILKRSYIPLAPDVEISSNTPFRFMCDIPNVEFSGFEQSFSSEVRLGDESCDEYGDQFPNMGNVLGISALVVLPEVPEEACEVTNDESTDEGFLEGCRPFVDIDRCYLKGPYRGVILSIIGLYANSGLYPLAYCIYEGETFLSWSWFLKQLRVFLKYQDDRAICFMNDRHKRVIGAFKMQ